jgi:hypothetical protein
VAERSGDTAFETATNSERPSKKGNFLKTETKIAPLA